jgi:hypothetical protein
MNPVPVELATIVAKVVDELVCAHTLLEMKVAVAFCAALMVRVQVDAVPLQAPVHPENKNPLAGIAAKVTDVPPASDAEHVPDVQVVVVHVPELPQVKAPELDVIVPLPVPASVTVSK